VSIASLTRRGCPRLTTTPNNKATAAYMGVSSAMLRKRRLLGLPPRFIRVGRKVLYRRSDIDEFLAERTVEPEPTNQIGVMNDV